MPDLKQIVKNKVVLYVSSRYAIYGIQFLNSIVIGVVLGYFHYAVWAFINLVLNYLAQLNFGVPHSLNVLLSIHKSDTGQTRRLLSTSLVLYIFLGLLIILVAGVMKAAGLTIGEKYNFDHYLLLVIAIALLTHFNALFTNYFRVYNRLNEILFSQSVVQVLTLLALIFIRGELLFTVLLAILFIGQVLSFCLYLFKARHELVRPDYAVAQTLLRRGFYLFLYNASFYMIMLTTRSVVSHAYTEVEFAMFSFTMILANTIMLLFDSFNFLIYPKTINRFSHAADSKEVLRILNLIRVNYITSVHLVMYLFILFYPFLIGFIPKYSSTAQVFTLMAMTVVFYSNCFVFSSLLTALGKERVLSRLSLTTLFMNIGFALLIVYVFKGGYEYVILATLAAYILYNIMLWYVSFRKLRIPLSLGYLLKDNFPARLFVPFGICLVTAICGWPAACYGGVLLLFIGLNWKQLMSIKQILTRILNDSSIINI